MEGGGGKIPKAKDLREMFSLKARENLFSGTAIKGQKM